MRRLFLSRAPLSTTAFESNPSCAEEERTRTEGEEREKKNEGRISKERNGLYNPELEHRGAAGALAAAISHLFVGDKRLCRDFKCQNKD